MATIRARSIALATLAGVSLAACNFALGLGGYDFSAGGTGGASSSTHGTGASTTTTTSSMGGLGGMGATVGTGGGHHDAGPDADAGMPRGVWSVRATDVTTHALVSSIAVSPITGNVFVAGSGDPTSDLGCMQTTDAGAGPEPGYLVELDGHTGGCTWAFVFGASAQGTGVAVDPTGHIALTGSYTQNAYLSGPWLSSPPWPPAVTSGTASFLIFFDSTHTIKWARSFGPNVTATGVAANGATVAVSGSYAGGNIQVGAPPGSLGSDSMSITAGGSDIQDAFLIWFAPTGTDATYLSDLEVTGFLQSASSVALDVNSVVAATGSTTGNTVFNGVTPGTMAPATTTIFALAYTKSKAYDFQTILGGGSAQFSSSIAFDLSSNVWLGGQFTGKINVSPPGMMDAGTSYTATNKSVLVASYDLSGNSMTSLSLGSTTGDTSIGGVAPYNNATVAFAGSFAGTAQLVVGMGTPTAVTSKGSNKNVYVGQFDTSTSMVRWLEAYGDGTKDQVADAVAVDPSPSGGDIVIAGHYQGELAFGGMGSPLTNSTGSDELFVAKLKP